MPAPMMMPTMMQTESNTDNIFCGCGATMANHHYTLKDSIFIKEKMRETTNSSGETFYTSARGSCVQNDRQGFVYYSVSLVLMRSYTSSGVAAFSS